MQLRETLTSMRRSKRSTGAPPSAGCLQGIRALDLFQLVREFVEAAELSDAARRGYTRLGRRLTLLAANARSQSGDLSPDMGLTRSHLTNGVPTRTRKHEN